MKQFKGANGYLYVRLGKSSSKTVHRLVAEAFILNPENKTTVNHKNGIKTDNRASNLEWATVAENTKHLYENKLQVNPNRKLSCENIYQIRKLYANGRSYNKLSRLFHLSRPCITRIVKGLAYVDC